MQHQLEMHHRVVPNAAMVESPGTYWVFSEGSSFASSHGGQLSYLPPGSGLLHTAKPFQKAFPIRASQSGSTMAQRPPTIPGSVLSSAQEPSEHKLRRKTPNGTIDAGYDGSPAQLVPGHPPFKHVILPITPWDSLGQGPGPSSHQPDLSNFSLRSIIPDPTFGAQNTAPLVYRSAFSASSSERDTVFHLASGKHNGQHQDGFAHTLELLGPSPTAYHPPQALQMPGYYTLLARSPQETIHHPLAGPFSDDLTAPGADMYAHTPGDRLSVSVSLSQAHQHNFPQSFHQLHGQSSNFQDPSQAVRHGTHPRLGGPSSGKAFSMQNPSFQQKALAQAHDTYLRLMAQRHMRKAHSMKLSPNSGSLSKTFIHPKLPPQFSSHPGLPAESQLCPALPLGGGELPEIRSSGQGDPFGPSVRGSSPRRSSLMPPIPLFQEHHSWGAGPTGWDQKRKFRASDAVKPLNTLHHLCEQSNWKWIDGMILGGCLCYSVEDYEGALEWFFRVIALDPRYYFSGHCLPTKR